MEKKILRQEIKKILVQMKNKEEKDKHIHENVFSLDVWKTSKVIATTISIKNEVDTYNIIKQGWLEGKVIVVPKCIPMNREMEFRVIRSFTDVEETFFGLQEPVVTATVLFNKEPDLVIVPGIAFTAKGERLGYGGGYYDRYLQSYKGITISLAYQEQIVKKINTELHDCSVQKIITDQEIYE